MTPAVFSTWLRALITPNLIKALVMASLSLLHDPGHSFSLSGRETLFFFFFIRDRNPFGNLFLCYSIGSEIRKHMKDLNLKKKADYRLEGIMNSPQIFMAGPYNCCSNGCLNLAHLYSIGTFWGISMALESDSLGSSIGSTSSKLCTLGQVTESLWASDATSQKWG